MNLDTEKLRTITEPNKDMYRNKLAESAVKDNLYNKGYRDGYNAAQKEIADQYAHYSICIEHNCNMRCPAYNFWNRKFKKKPDKKEESDGKR